MWCFMWRPAVEVQNWLFECFKNIKTLYIYTGNTRQKNIFPLFVQFPSCSAATASASISHSSMCMDTFLVSSLICSQFFFRTLQREYEQLKEQHGQRGTPTGSPWETEGPSAHPDEADLLAEARLLRQHKGRLETRMHILEEHNKQLESQLHRLRQLLHQVTYHVHILSPTWGYVLFPLPTVVLVLCRQKTCSLSENNLKPEVTLLLLIQQVHTAHDYCLMASRTNLQQSRGIMVFSFEYSTYTTAI